MRQAIRRVARGTFIVICFVVDALTALAILILAVAWNTP